MNWKGFGRSRLWCKMKQVLWLRGPKWHSRCIDSLWAGRSMDRILVGVRFSTATILTGMIIKLYKFYFKHISSNWCLFNWIETYGWKSIAVDHWSSLFVLTYTNTSLFSTPTPRCEFVCKQIFETQIVKAEPTGSCWLRTVGIKSANMNIYIYIYIYIYIFHKCMT